MIYLQYDHEFNSMLFRIVKLKKYTYHKKEGHIQADSYECLIEFENDSGVMTRKDYSLAVILGDGDFMPKNDKIVPDSDVIKLIFNDGLWPGLKYKKIMK